MGILTFIVVLIFLCFINIVISTFFEHHFHLVYWTLYSIELIIILFIW